MKELGYVLFGIYVVLTLWLFINGLLQLHLWFLARKNYPKTSKHILQKIPFVTIQLPVYNEKYVVEGLLRCLSQLHYPKKMLEIFVLDDSTDETTQIVEQEVRRLQELGFQIVVCRRTRRTGYKAGALQENLPQCKGEFIALFDADFRPGPRFLLDLLPHFTDAETGIVQARWTHQNQQQNFLTRIQSYLLDTYFAIEMEGRNKGSYFSNFCGTAGIWRKSCIEDAGGWDGNILSEDLDLSYRAQLKGWKVKYDHTVFAPAELPAELDSFKIQQSRWTKGIMQVCRKNLGAVFSAPLPWFRKVHAFFHLTGSFVFPCLFITSSLSLPLLFLRHHFVEFITLTNLSTLGGINLIITTIVFYHGSKTLQNNVGFPKYYTVFLLVYMGLSVQNTIAVIKGLLGYRSAFVRTPKFADHKASATTYLLQLKNRTIIAEMLMFFYFIFAIVASFYMQDYFFLLLFFMMGFGIGMILFHSISWRSFRWPFIPFKISWR